MRSNLISSNVFLVAFLHIFLLIHSKPLVPALYVFGDSLFDSGNNNLLPTVAKANYPPYGQNFVDHFTGRFTNGRTLPDFIAEFLHLPYPPPYLSIRESVKLTGLNYASSACGILPETGSRYGKCLSLCDQIDLFRWTIESKVPSHFKGSKKRSNYLAKSIFMVTIGSNDYIQNLEPPLLSRSHDCDPQTFAQLLTDALSNNFERLYRLGARKIVMFEIAPLGCIPHYTRKYELKGKCHHETNQIVSYFNNMLHATLKNLTSTLQGSMFSLARINSLVHDYITNPSKYGYTDTSYPCCTTWGNGTSLCIPWLVPCPNPNEHLFWDGYHNTEIGNSIAASLCFNDSEFCTPFSIRELIQI
ncbi:GDSL esterase/lipase 7-like [Durio zibethinus]|uniref:GDSL esterase/lipase 7-like n=1 Tax=Durio zibethinus TaxID=66656 RepID=A0A6P6A5V9_DURZI|nr:GDSL esterase/lipase 7-like [Durio zibethinus]